MTVGVCPLAGRAEVNVNIGIGLPAPPRLVISAPPPVVVIPDTYVYFAPEIEADLLFYHDYWYRPHHGRWFRASAYNGPWVFVETVRVPRALVQLPPDYRRVHAGHPRIPYGEMKKNWRSWERDKHWDRHGDKHDHRFEKVEATGGRGKHHDRD
jgi:hypothetical protein